jgi:hypothetical protein
MPTMMILRYVALLPIRVNFSINYRYILHFWGCFVFCLVLVAAGTAAVICSCFGCILIALVCALAGTGLGVFIGVFWLLWPGQNVVWQQLWAVATVSVSVCFVVSLLPIPYCIFLVEIPIIEKACWCHTSPYIYKYTPYLSNPVQQKNSTIND